MKNNLFEIVWSWHDEDNTYLYTHDNKTDSEFQEDVKMLLRKYGKEYLETEESWAGANKWIEFVSGKMHELGYNYAKPAQFSFFGGYIFKDKKIDPDEDGIEEKKWAEIVGQDLMDAALLHNQKIEDRN